MFVDMVQVRPGSGSAADVNGCVHVDDVGTPWCWCG